MLVLNFYFGCFVIEITVCDYHCGKEVGDGKLAKGFEAKNECEWGCSWNLRRGLCKGMG